MLAGHVSKRLLERYSLIRTQAKRDAIASLELVGENTGFAPLRVQEWAQSPEAEAPTVSAIPKKSLN